MNSSNLPMLNLSDSALEWLAILCIVLLVAVISGALEERSIMVRGARLRPLPKVGLPMPLDIRGARWLKRLMTRSLGYSRR